jgi:hypothetical protein
MAEHAEDKVLGHSSADNEYATTPTGAGHEHTDANIWSILKFILWLAVAAAVIHLGLALLFSLFVEQRVERAAPAYPLAVGESQRLPPEPRLQRFPREDIMNFRLTEEQQLDTYGWVDKTTGIVHIPVQEAMKLILERGLPARAQQPAEEATEAPGLMPSDASSGRIMERRRQ